MKPGYMARLDKSIFDYTNIRTPPRSSFPRKRGIQNSLPGIGARASYRQLGRNDVKMSSQIY
jgi:hypothetical protein